MDQPFRAVRRDDCYVIEGPHLYGNALPTMKFATLGLAADIASYMSYAYFTGKHDGVRELSSELRASFDGVSTPAFDKAVQDASLTPQEEGCGNKTVGS